jgi:serine protease Do
VSGGLGCAALSIFDDEAGIQPGDVVLSVDGTPVQSVAQLRKMVQEHDKQVALLIQRGNSRLFVPVTLG